MMVIELSGAIQSDIILVISNSNKCTVQVWFQTKIAPHEVQLPFYDIYVEIAKFGCSNTGFSYSV